MDLFLDTHAWAWSLTGNSRLSPKAVGLLQDARNLFVSPISFYEIGYKVRGGKWPEMLPIFPNLSALLDRQEGRVAPLSAEIATLAASLDWSHRDPFDRMIVASAMHMNMPLVSVDKAFDNLAGQAGWPGRVW